MAKRQAGRRACRSIKELAIPADFPRRTSAQKPPAEAGGMTRGHQRRRERKRTPPSRGFLGILISMAVSVRQLLRLLEEDGWVEVRQRGSHRQFRHPSKSGTVTVAGKESADVPPGTLNSVLKQAGLKNQRQQKKEGES